VHIGLKIKGVNSPIPTAFHSFHIILPFVISGTMIAAGLVVALVGLTSAHENASPFEAALINSFNGVGLPNSFNGLVARDDQCPSSQDVCGTEFCMPKGGSCCDTIKGTYCKLNYYCYPQGCCPNGKVCKDTPTGGCEAGKQSCGSVCIDGSSVCCNPTASTDNSWCDYPETCNTNGKCVAKSLVTSATAAPSSSSTSPATTDASITSGGSSAKATDSGDQNNGKKDDNKSTPVGPIVGGVIGGVAALALIGLGIFLLLRNNKKKQAAATEGQNVQPLMQQYPPQMSPDQGMGYAPPQGSPPPQGYYPPPVGAYSPSMATEKFGSQTGTYSTDPRTGASTVSPATGFTGTPPPPGQVHAGEQPVIHEMSARPGEDRHGNLHELA
jgi:hypothetical protein